MRSIALLVIFSCIAGAGAFQLPVATTYHRWSDSLQEAVVDDSNNVTGIDSSFNKREKCQGNGVCIPDTVPIFQKRTSENDTGGLSSHSIAEKADTLRGSDSAVYSLPTTVVRASVAQLSERQYAQSAVQFAAEDIKKKAGTVEDVSRYLGTLPSVVSSIGEGYDNTLFIRGGRPSEVIFCVDGIEMENVNHFSKANGCGGPIGYINSDNVREVTYYAGVMPVSAPPRLSSAIDIRMDNGSLYQSQGAIGCKLTGGMFSLEGPLKTGVRSFSLSGRYADFTALRFYVKNAGIPKVGDLYGKIFTLVNDVVDISATSLLSWSNYRFSYPMVMADNRNQLFENQINEHETILQGGAGAVVRYMKDDNLHEARLAVSFRDGLQKDSLDSWNDTFFVNRYAVNPIQMGKDRRIRVQFNTKSRLRLTANHDLQFGIRTGANGYAFQEKDQSQFEGDCIVCRDDGPDTIPVKQDPLEKRTVFYGVEPGAFLSYAFTLGILQADIGARVDYFDLLDRSVLSPRLSCMVRPWAAGAFSASWGLYHQFPIEMPSLIFACLPQNVPADSLESLERILLKQMEPQRCWQGAVGYDKVLREQNDFRIETWYKWYDREYDFIAPEVQNIIFRDETGELRLRDQDGCRRAYGIEGSLAYKGLKRFFYYVGGSLFDVKNRYQDATWKNDWTNVRYTYSLSAGVGIRGSHHVSFSVQGTGGRPFCPEQVVADCIGRKIAVYDNSLPYFSRRLDKLVAANARYSFSGRISQLQAELFVELLNVLDYTPTLEYKWNGERFVEVKPFKITPIAGCRIAW